MYFYKIKTFEISYRKVKISISPWGGNLQFLVRGERYLYVKKFSPQGEFHLAYVPLRKLVRLFLLTLKKLLL